MDAAPRKKEVRRPRDRTRPLLASALLIAVVLAAPSARADGPDAIARATARKLGGRPEALRRGRLRGRAREVQHGRLARPRAHARPLRGALPGQARPHRGGVGALPGGHAHAARPIRAARHAQSAGGRGDGAREAPALHPDARGQADRPARRRRRGVGGRQDPAPGSVRREAPGPSREARGRRKARRYDGLEGPVHRPRRARERRGARAAAPAARARPEDGAPPRGRLGGRRRGRGRHPGGRRRGARRGGEGAVPALAVPGARLRDPGDARAGGPVRRLPHREHDGLRRRRARARGGRDARDRLAQAGLGLPRRPPCPAAARRGAAAKDRRGAVDHVRRGGRARRILEDWARAPAQASLRRLVRRRLAALALAAITPVDGCALPGFTAPARRRGAASGRRAPAPLPLDPRLSRPPGGEDTGADAGPIVLAIHTIERGTTIP